MAGGGADGVPGWARAVATAQDPQPDAGHAASRRSAAAWISSRCAPSSGMGAAARSPSWSRRTSSCWIAASLRRIVNFDRDPGPVGVALLFDVSGSMDVGPKLERARDAAFFLLGSLQTGMDEAAIYAFDSTLHVVQPFTTNLDQLKGRLSMVTPWGVTSLHDAIAAAAESMGSKGTQAPGARRAHGRHRHQQPDAPGRGGAHRERHRRAGLCRGDRVARSICRTRTGGREIREDAPREGTLSDLARWTGGQLFSNTAAGAVERHRAAHRRGAAPPVSDRVRAERSSGLASARVEGPPQGPHRAGPQWVRGRAIPPGQRVIGRAGCGLPSEEACDA